MMSLTETEGWKSNVTKLIDVSKVPTEDPPAITLMCTVYIYFLFLLIICPVLFMEVVGPYFHLLSMFG